MTVDSMLVHTSQVIAAAVALFIGLMSLVTFFRLKKLMEINC